jgi:hypothetical protein
MSWRRVQSAHDSGILFFIIRFDDLVYGAAIAVVRLNSVYTLVSRKAKTTQPDGQNRVLFETLYLSNCLNTQISYI